MLKTLLIVDGDVADPWSEGLKDILEENQLFDVKITNDASGLLSDKKVAFDYDLFVVGCNSRPLDGAARVNFLGSLADGAGLVILPSTSSIAQLGAPEPLAVIDCEKQGNASQPHSVHFVDHHHPITRALRDFDIAEPASKTTLRPGPNTFVIATATTMNAASPMPVFAVTKRDRARIFQSAFGDASSPATLTNEAFRLTIARGAEWTCSGNVLDF